MRGEPEKNIRLVKGFEKEEVNIIVKKYPPR